MKTMSGVEALALLHWSAGFQATHDHSIQEVQRSIVRLEVARFVSLVVRVLLAILISSTNFHLVPSSVLALGKYQEVEWDELDVALDLDVLTGGPDPCEAVFHLETLGGNE